MAGDGLDREAIERRVKAARAAWFLSGPGEDVPEMAESAADVPALLAALKAAEERLRAVEAAAWAAVRAQMPGSDDDARCDALLHLEGVLRTEGDAS